MSYEHARSTLSPVIAVLMAVALVGCDSGKQRVAKNLHERVVNGDCGAYYDLWEKAEKKDPYSSAYFGMVLQDGTGARCRTTEVVALRAYAPARGKMKEVDFNAALLLIKTKDFTGAEQALIRAAGGDKKNGLTVAMVKLAEIYEAGLAGFPQSQALAAQYYRAASEKGDLHARTKLAQLLISGKGTEQDIQRGTEALESAALLGHREARWILFQLADKPPAGQERRPEAAAKWLGAAAIVDPRLTDQYVAYVGRLDADMQVKVQTAVQRFHESVKRAWVPADYDKPIEPT